MKLRTLRLQGFKSFADATEVQFHDGMTAVVGPNGCGKSNISDAIRWVLGEQRPSAIRGGKMEEAIFQGSIRRRPVNRGSVSITVSNEDGLLPVPFQEVEIGRTVYRDGGSEYSLNRASCRLRDVVDLCRDTGLGANAYSMIEGRMVDAILSDRADERRSLFEEASGIGKYKDRRKVATRRLETAEIDLQRLEDVIAEVQTKVRSLARQKGKAQRYLELRARQLSVEVTVTRQRLETLRARLQHLEHQLQGDTEVGPGVTAEVTAAEAQLESLRIAQVEAERDRHKAAAALESVRNELVRWERDLAVAGERQSYAERRLEQIAREDAEVSEQQESLAGEHAGLAATEQERAEEVGRAREAVDRARALADDVRMRLVDARDVLERLSTREREIVHQAARLDGDAAAAETQAHDLASRIQRLGEELEGTAAAVSDLQSQGDLFAGRLDDLRLRVDEARRQVQGAQSGLGAAREGLDARRAEEAAAREASSALSARIEALEQMERDQEGMEPVVAAILALGWDGVLGVLGDSVHGARVAVEAVEAYLGPLANGVLVRSAADASAVEQWFRTEWGGGGGLFLLPLDSVPTPASAGGSLLGQVEIDGPGASWAQALLANVDLAEALEGPSKHDGRARVTRGGLVQDELGIFRVGRPLGGGGSLTRREELRELRERHGALERAISDATAARSEGLSRLAQAEADLETARTRAQEAEAELHRADADIAASADHRTRLDRHHEELLRHLEGTRAAQVRATDRARSARSEREALVDEEQRLGGEREQARARVEQVTEEWEEARADEARHTVQFTRIESELERLRDRRQRVEEQRQVLAQRQEALTSEQTELRAELETVATLRQEGEEALARLFQDRDRATSELRARDEKLAEIADAVSEADTRARRARAVEREATERRHKLELEAHDVAARIERVHDRLEAEWGKSFEELEREAEPVEGDPEMLEDELRDLSEQVARIGPVNMLAVEEHEEESQRLKFLEEQRTDLFTARDDLRTAIKQINQTATSLFTETFEAIRTNFQATFQRLFQGGEADLWLADPEDPLESAIEIHASPRGKKTQRIDLLSGGERALTALSLLFGIYLVKPSPFCVLDEVDAPLDESNIARFIRLLHEFKSQTQFIVITHNPRTIEAADWIYGVTMEEPGVSNIVGVRLEEALQVSGAA
ncbi:MAG: chromosome segregation protein SMC [Gemmatimonadota bacterium]